MELFSETVLTYIWTSEATLSIQVNIQGKVTLGQNCIFRVCENTIDGRKDKEKKTVLSVCGFGRRKVSRIRTK